MHKSGFVNILGNPNVGKSTLMNAMVGQKLSIVSPKVQTTRHRIMGILNGEDYQIVYSDTPGIIKPGYKLHEQMMKYITGALTDADIILYITDVQEKVDPEGEIIQKIKNIKVPVIIVINKIDLTTQPALETLTSTWKEWFPGSDVIPVSAIYGFNLDQLLKTILNLLPEGPPYFPKDQITDKMERFFAAEIIREKIFLNYRQEIPYSVEVEIESFTDLENLSKIRAVIHVARESQKGIIIGHQGKMLKKIGTEARKEMEEFFGRKIYLELYVKVTENWRDNPAILKRFGY
ncbi:MAG TPA: GTPase Era [Bacteroidales bacterium]|nr:GTPase Era [Bacteroidales bacterium]HOK73532.1 GTPase Era [Bacteroidales bacterium]HOM39810.1 GTPase Era [Bacteroidales bacterium]HPP91366.1 GTPase Era [Bacteroidales bacterium]HRR15298.1 GTPase Era [Bacteroidales bacterium]